MQRDMSYDLDGMFAGRNAGELVTVQQTRTRVQRSPGLAPMARMAGGDVRNLTPLMAHKLGYSRPRPILRHPSKRIDASGARNIQKSFYTPASDLGDNEVVFGDLGAVNLPIVGMVSVGALALAAGAAFVGYKLLK